MTDLKQKILSHVQADLAEIEAALRDNLGAHLDIVREVASHIMFSGGKRLRPLLMVLAARLCGYSGDRDAFFSTIFEYLHVATLLHDDLVDDAALRRGKPAAYALYGNSVAVLTGDFLLARSLSIASETSSPEVIRIIAGITENMSQGEIDQLMRKEHLSLTEAEYLEIIRRKTAVLIEGACRVGALIAGDNGDQEAALKAYGYHLGIAFQMADDLLDYVSDTGSLGKAVGADLREGKLTLPVIRTLEKASVRDRKQMEQIIVNKEFSLQDFCTLVGFLKIYGGISYTQQQAEDHIRKAKASLSGFGDSDTKDLLLDIADYALSRKS